MQRSRPQPQSASLAAMRAVRVLVVDDSSFMRSALVRMLESEPTIKVVATGHNGADAVDLVQELEPDVVTLDLEMPVMDGLAALARIMRERPTPVLMLSAHTRPGAEATLRALELGAADFMVKPDHNSATEVKRLRDGLIARVLALACRNAGPKAPPPAPAAPARLALPSGAGLKLVVIGASTGGPRALQQLFAGLPQGLDAAVVVVQHMPRLFTGPFAERLSAAGGLTVREAAHGQRLEAGTAVLAPGDSHLEISRMRGTHAWVGLTTGGSSVLHRPSIDMLFRSAAQLAGDRALGVVLTGMGSDGCEGMRRIREAGGITLAQDEDSCVVYGMPRACVEAGAVQRVVPLEEMAAAICKAAGIKAGAAGQRRAS